MARNRSKAPGPVEGGRKGVREREVAGFQKPFPARWVSSHSASPGGTREGSEKGGIQMCSALTVSHTSSPTLTAAKLHTSCVPREPGTWPRAGWGRSQAALGVKKVVGGRGGGFTHAAISSTPRACTGEFTLIPSLSLPAGGELGSWGTAWHLRTSQVPQLLVDSHVGLPSRQR